MRDGGVESFGEGREVLALVFLVGQVLGFGGVGMVVVEFGGDELVGIFVSPFHVSVLVGADGAAHGPVAAGVLGEGGVLAVPVFLRRILHEGDEGIAFELGGEGELGELGEGGVEVDEFGEAVGFRGDDVWSGNDEGDAGAPFEVGHFGPGSVFAEVPAVVGGEDDDGVVGEAFFFEGVEEAAHLGVDVRDAGKVGVAEGDDEVVVEDALVGDVVIAAEFEAGPLDGVFDGFDAPGWGRVPAGGVAAGFGGVVGGVVVSDDVGVSGRRAMSGIGEEGLIFWVEVEVFFGGDEGEVGASVSDGEEEGLVFEFFEGGDGVGGHAAGEEGVVGDIG